MDCRRTKLPKEGWPSAVAILVILAVAAAALMACSSSSESDDPAVATPTDPIAIGQKVFASNCAACHGAGGVGQSNWHIRKADGSLPAPPLNATVSSTA